MPLFHNADQLKRTAALTSEPRATDAPQVPYSYRSRQRAPTEGVVFGILELDDAVVVGTRLFDQVSRGAKASSTTDRPGPSCSSENRSSFLALPSISTIGQSGGST